MTLALANKESLVAAGELALAAWKRGGGLLAARRQRALRALPVPRGHAPRDGRLGRPHRLGRAVPKPSRDGARISDRGGGARASDVVHGAEDHGRLGHAREQGPRADRGALPLRPRLRARSRSSCIRPRSCTRSSASATARSLAHLGYPDMRVPISFALTYPERARDRRVPRPRLLGRPRRSSSSRRTPSASRCCALAREAGERGGTYPCAFNAANEVAVAAFLDGRIGFPEIAALVEDALERVDGAPARDLDELVEADAEARRLAQGRLASRHEHLHRDPRSRRFLILVHEAGHFFASLRRRPAAAALLHRVPARDRQDDPQRASSTGIGAIPLGGFVTIPGMHRPIPHDAERRFSRAVEEAPTLAGPVDRVKRALDGDDLDVGARRARRLRGRLERARRSRPRPRVGREGLTELRDALGPDAYWKAPTWKRLVAIAAGPAATSCSTIVALHRSCS